MSHQAVSWVLEHCPTVKGSDRLVLLSIANHCDPEGDNAWPSIATLAKEAALSETRVKQALRTLRASGVIVVTANAGGKASERADRRPNLYRIPFRVRPDDRDGPDADGGQPSTPRPDPTPVGPSGATRTAPAEGSETPDPASEPAGGTEGTRVTPVAAARGADRGGHGGHETGGTGDTRVTTNSPSEQSIEQPLLSSAVTSPATRPEASDSDPDRPGGWRRGLDMLRRSLDTSHVSEPLAQVADHLEADRALAGELGWTEVGS